MHDETNLPLSVLYKDLEGAQRALWQAWDHVSELELKHRPERPRCKVAWTGTFAGGEEYAIPPDSVRSLRSHPTYALDRRYAVEAYYQYIRELRDFEQRTGITEARQKAEEQRERVHNLENAIAATPIRSRQDAAIKAHMLNDDLDGMLVGWPEVVWGQLHEWLVS